MYSIRAELMYRHYVKDGSLDLSDIERISLASYDDLLGEMYDYEIVPVKGKGVKLTEFLYDINWIWRILFTCMVIMIFHLI